MQLKRFEKAELRVEMSRKIGTPGDPKYATIHTFVCHFCGSKKYYGGDSDPDSPQYITLRKMTKLGFGIGAAVCHDCFHEKEFKNALVRHSSGCRICELAYWARLARRRAKVQTRLEQEAKTLKSAKNGLTKQVPTDSERKRLRGGAVMPKRRKHDKNVEDGRSRRRRSRSV